MAAWKCASDAAGMMVPPDTEVEFSVAVVVCVSLWSASLKFIVPVSVCRAVESVVLAVSVKLPDADDDVKTGVWLVMKNPCLFWTHGCACAGQPGALERW